VNRDRVAAGAQPAVDTADQPPGGFRQRDRSSGGGDGERVQPAITAAEGRRRLPDAQEQIRQGTHRQDRGVGRDQVRHDSFLR